jgi:NAD(P)-dependent dehydrogenase (short-subunit alcohol dehydrogenase family)
MDSTRRIAVAPDLPARTALVTGASRGLGRALAQSLAARGWTLLITARGAAALEEVREQLARLTRVVALAGDVADGHHRRRLAEAAEAIGGLDAVVNNASTIGTTPRPQLLDYPLDDLERVYRTNAVAPLGLLQAVRSALRPRARVLAVTSDAGVEPYDGWGGYGSSKAALEHWTAVLAVERPDLRVYTVDPGDMRTQMQREAFPDRDLSDLPPPEESVPGLLELLDGDLASGRYLARDLGAAVEA